MAGMCCGMNIGDAETAAPGVDAAAKSARRRRMEIHQFNFVPSDSAVLPPIDGGGKKRRRRIDMVVPVLPAKRVCMNAVRKLEIVKRVKDASQLATEGKAAVTGGERGGAVAEYPKFGTTSVCGRRRDMEDAIAIHPSFTDVSGGLHYFGVFDGHGCSHVSYDEIILKMTRLNTISVFDFETELGYELQVATRCKDRMHEIVKSEVENAGESPWEHKMSQSFSKMDKDVTDWSSAAAASCRCELQTPHCDAVGSTAVVALLSPEKIVVSNCGDSRAVLCRNGVAIPLSVDHKPDRPDELHRIQESGGRVIFWDGPRVLGVLAMSRAIGDNYLKPYVISEPEVTITERTPEDECLILASDGLWDVVSNETACGVARMCLQSRKPLSPPRSPGHDVTVTAAGESSDQACSDASILLTKLALARQTTDNVSVVVVDLRRQ